MTLRELAESAVPALTAAGIEDARLEARLLACHAGQTSLASYYAGAPLPHGAATRFETMLARRLTREPLAYIIGQAEFFGLTLAVGPGVLIPRPETEQLVEVALDAARGYERPTVVDVGTGSGCIAIALAAYLPEARIIAIEPSTDALAVAAHNVVCHRSPVSLVRASLASPIRSANIVVANLPYIPTDRIPALQPEVRDWEPSAALDGGPDGEALIRALIDDCAARLRPDHLLLEADAPGAHCVAAYATGLGARVSVHKDFAGLDRIVWTRW